MKMIKILLTSIVLLVVFLFLIMPPLIGLGVRYQCGRLLSQLNHSYPNITATISHYRFGWFTSKIDIRLDVHFKKGTLEHKIGSSNTRQVAFMTIRQGPIIIRKQRGHYNPYLALADIDITSPQLRLKAHSIWHLSLWASAQFTSPSFQIISAPCKIIVKTLQGMLYFHLSLKHFKAHTSIDTFNLEQTASGQPIIAINKLLYHANLKKMDFVRLGQQTLTIKKMMVSLGKDDSITLSNILAHTNSRLTNGGIEMTANYKIKPITQNKFDINGLNIHFSIKNVDEKRFNELLNVLSKHKTLTSTDYESFAKPGLDLLQQGLNINLKQLTLNTSSGAVSLVGTLNIPKQSNGISLLEIPTMINANFYFQSPKTWFTKQLSTYYAYLASKQTPPPSIDPQKMAENTLQKWAQERFIIIDGNQLKTRLQFQKGLLFFNGRPAIPTLPGTKDSE